MLENVEQWVDKVTAFSSQYGASRGSWAAMNIEGPPTTYPAYGDIATAWAPQQAAKGHEFLEFRVARKVRLTGLHIYETCAPGALVKAAVRVRGEWISVWRGASEACERKARIFKPAFEPLAEEVDEFRLEFDTSKNVSEWYEIDCIKIVGLAPPHVEETKPPASGTVCGDLLKLLGSGGGDVVFVTSTGVEARAHRCIVNARCPALLITQTLSGTIAVVEDFETLRIILAYIYAECTEIPASFAIPVFLSATRLGLLRLADAAADVLQRSLRPTNVVAVLKVVEPFARLRKICLEHMARNVKAVTEGGANAGALAPLSAAQLADLVCTIAKVSEASGSSSDS